MILLSAHKDVVFHPYNLKYENGKFIGLLDNYIGQLIVNGLFLEEPNLIKFERDGSLKVFFGGGEEWGRQDDFPKITKKDLVIVVDVCSGSQYKGIDFSIECISGVKDKDVKTLKENLEWEGFKMRTKKYDGNPDDEDESYHWVKLGIPVMSFIIPIENGSKDTGWHNDDCTIAIEKVLKCKQGLKRLINYLL